MIVERGNGQGHVIRVAITLCNFPISHQSTASAYIDSSFRIAVLSNVGIDVPLISGKYVLWPGKHARAMQIRGP